MTLVLVAAGLLVAASLLALWLFGVESWSDARTLQISSIAIVGALAILTANLALWSGRLELANTIIIVLAFGGVTVATWCGGALPNPGLFGYVLVTVVAAVLAPGAGAIATGLASAAAILGLVGLRQAIPPNPALAPETLIDFLASVVTTGAIIIVILWRSGSSARRAIGRAHDQQLEAERGNRELLASEARLRGIIDHMRDLVAEIDAEGCVVYASPNHFELTGRRAEELIGRHVTDFIHPDDLAQHAGVYPEAGALPDPFRVRLADGSWRWMEISLTPFESGDGATRALSITRDVTTRVAAESQARERRAAASHAQKMEALGRFAGGVTHELNNLMTVITLNTELLCGVEKLPETTFAPIRHIGDSAEQATALTRRLIGFAREAEPTRTSLEFDAEVRVLALLLRPVVGERVQFDLSLDASGRRVEVDPTELAQIAMNLVVNAKAAVEDNGVIEVATRFVSLAKPRACYSGALPAGSYVVLRISDTGAGMDEATCERIFEPFFTTHDEDGASGLGLSMVYATVRRAGGDVAVESEIGSGTRIDAFFPVAAEVAANADSPAEDVEIQGGRETLLIVEDRVSVRVAIARSVRTLGYRVLEASGGEQALEIEHTFEEPIDLLVTDVVMPGMQGPELAGKLCERRPGLRVLYLTAYSGGAFSGASRLDHPVLYKPAGRAVLAAKLRRVLEAKAGASNSDVGAQFPGYAASE